jgi:hypothetical protein
MPEEQPTTEAPTVLGDAVDECEPLDEQDVWLEEAEELPPRPRRRVLTPLPLALLAALAIAGGFIAGVLVEKGQGGSTSAAGGGGGAFASRLAALRGGASSGASSSGTTSGSSSGSRSGAAGGASSGLGLAGAAGSGAAGSATVGQVAYATRGTLYVTTSEGNTVKVTAAPGAGVTKTVKTSIAAIHPGETVIVAGSSAANGAISASSVRVGSVATGLGGGAAALFGGATGGAAGGRGTSSSGASSGATTSGASEPQLFGKG